MSGVWISSVHDRRRCLRNLIIAHLFLCFSLSDWWQWSVPCDVSQIPVSPWQILTFPLLILLKFRNNQGWSGQATEIAGEFGHFYTGHSLVAWKEWWLLYANIPKWFSHSSSSYCSSILLRVKDEWIKVVKQDILACIASVNYVVMHLTDYLSTVYFLFHTLLKSCSVIKHVRFGP